jgi:hypothetical protein
MKRGPREETSVKAAMNDDGQGNKTFPSIGALKHAGKPSLGDPKVVWGVLGEMLKVASDDPRNSVAAVRKATAILIGRDPDYATMGPWNQEGIGDWIRGHMNGVPADGAPSPRWNTRWPTWSSTSLTPLRGSAWGIRTPSRPRTASGG